jgi:alpha-tubulin suppressor-like RCC1 family protein
VSWSAYALGLDGRLLSWGRNDDGQLGDGTRIDRPVPQDITDGFGLIDGERLTTIEAGDGHMIALTSANRVFTWGRNSSGQLGNDSTSREESPFEITSRFGLHHDELVADIIAGSRHSLLVTSTGRVFTWGSNGSGQLGNGTTTSQRTPLEITDHFGLPEDERVIAITAGTTHTLALTSQGRLFAWGSNTSGQLGYELQISRKTPFDITSMMRLDEDESITGLGASGYTSYVLTSHGSLLVWGGNTKGQIGDGTTDTRFSPFDITPSLGLSEDDMIEEVILGPTHMGVITQHQRVIVWGSNLYGSFGNGTTSDVVQMPTDITHVFGLDENESLIGLSFGSESTYAVTSHHRVLAFGSNHYNKLAYTQGTLPYPVLGPVIRTRMHVYDTPYEVIAPVTDTESFIGWTLNQGSDSTFRDGLMPAYDITLFSYREPAS